MGKHFERQKHQRSRRGSSLHWKGGSGSRAESISRRRTRIHDVTVDIFPNVKSRKQKKAAVFATHVLFNMPKNVSRQTKNDDGETGKGSLAIERNVKQLGCLSPDVDFSSETAARSMLKRYSPAAERSIQIRTERSSSGGLASSRTKFLRPKFRGSLSRVFARREAWDLATQVCEIGGDLAQKRATCFSLSENWCMPAPC